VSGRHFWVFIGVFLFITACEKPSSNVSQPTADRVFLNAKVYTLDSDQPWVEAVAVSDGHIVFVGSTQEAQAWVGEQTTVDDLGGQMLLPGFHDSHAHLLIGIATEEDCDLLRIDSVDEVVGKLHECTLLDGFGSDRWLIGSGWGDWLWPNAEPDKAILDELFPDRPVYLSSSFGHSAWVNSRALALAGITDETMAEADGVIVRDPGTGEATGALHDSAMLLIKDILPGMTMEYRQKSIRAGIEMAHSLGVTAVIEPGADAEILAPLHILSDSGEFDMRALMSLSPINWQPGTFGDEVFEFLADRERWRRPNIDVDSVKIYMDGVIESGTGALLEPYENEKYGLGPRFYPQEKVDEYFTRFDAMGLQIHVHALGDAGIRMALDGFQAMQNTNGVSDNRHHMTHLQLINEVDIPRFAELNIGATYQSLWAYPDPAAIELDIPAIGEERTYQMYPIGSIHRAGGRINGASDYFVTDMNPLLAIEVAITRQDPYSNAGPVLNAYERVDLETMLEAYTVNGAYTMGLEDKQGTIKIGKRADLVVLDRNLFEIPSSEISEASVTMTIFDGRTVYSKNE
jgi:predicted amidohydrolase YtcJ